MSRKKVGTTSHWRFADPRGSEHVSDRARNAGLTVGAGLCDARPMEEKAVRRAVLVTRRRAILQRFPPGPERAQWLELASERREIDHQH
jgi:hypothetical protein